MIVDIVITVGVLIALVILSIMVHFEIDFHTQGTDLVVTYRESRKSKTRKAIKITWRDN